MWLDLDGDGVQDAGESGIPNVTVYLKDSGGATIRTVTTDADGTYNFFLPTETGDFTVEVDTATLPVGLVQSGDPDATCPSAGCDDKNPVNVPAVGTIIDTADFGYRYTGEISGTIYDDLDEDEDQNGSDPGLVNIEVGLYESDGTTPVLDSEGNPLVVTTDGNGDYRFENLPGGNYVIVVDPDGDRCPAILPIWKSRTTPVAVTTAARL